MAKVAFIVTGDKRTALNLRLLERDTPKIVGGTLFRQAERVMTEIKTVPLVPVDTGVLRNTGHVDPPQRDARGVSVTMGFGGPAAPYAAVQHERLDYNHPVGQAKYLSEPLNRNLRTISRAIAAAIRDFVRRLPKR